MTCNKLVRLILTGTSHIWADLHLRQKVPDFYVQYNFKFGFGARQQLLS